MNQTVNLQIPIDTNLRNQALIGAKELGFTNLQDSIRIFLQQLALKSFKISFETKPVVLSAKNDLKYSKIINDIKSGKEKSIGFQNTKDMIEYLDVNS
ncbi:hypothetical protein AUK05_01220 [Candidatus Shapirobacteria bacterium CG2_30_35_20]|uniref:Damage-inducible protein J n=1 Tax=Candidatus Shapirobacteria bacterium CG2_30_35_20 TaxID=1805376 RepID=A0A1J5HQ50_9BACT|nr:MAG: hypothetical protein AUK05_01220 [Candidatus Shapirobacteria bacterium CG2_30_35_20]